MVSVNDLADAISAELMDYKEEIDEAMQKEITKIGKDVVNLLKTHPNIPVKTGNYKKSFALKKVAQGVGYMRVVVHSKDQYQLTHLLEKGHATRNGGRTKAYPHWENAQKIADMLPDRLKAVLE